MQFKSNAVYTVLAAAILDIADAQQTTQSVFNPFNPFPPASVTPVSSVFNPFPPASVTPVSSVFDPFVSIFDPFNTASSSTIVIPISTDADATILTSSQAPSDSSTDLPTASSSDTSSTSSSFVIPTFTFPTAVPTFTTGDLPSFTTGDLPSFTIDTSSRTTSTSFVTITSTEEITSEEITSTETALVASVNGPYTAVQFIEETFSAAGSSEDAEFYIWTFGDEIPGRTNTTVVLGTEVNHTYTEAGIFEVCVIIEVGGVRSEPDCTEADVAEGVTIETETSTQSQSTSTSVSTVFSTVTVVDPDFTPTETQVDVIPDVEVPVVDVTGTITGDLTQVTTFDPLATQTKTELVTTNVATVVITTLEPSDGVSDDGFESGFFVDFSAVTGLFESEAESDGVLDLAGLQADAGGPYYGSVGIEIEFDASLTTPGGEGSLEDLSFQWRFGDETATTPSTVVNGSVLVDHTYLAVNEYRVCLTVIQGDGASVDCTTAFIEANDEEVTDERSENLLTAFNEEDWDDVGTGFSVSNGVLTAPLNGGAYQQVELNQTRTAQLFLQSFVTAFDYSAFTHEQSLPIIRVMVFYENQDETVENFSFRAPETSEGGEELSYVINPAFPVKNATVYTLHIGDAGQSSFEDIFFGPVVLF